MAGAGDFDADSDFEDEEKFSRNTLRPNIKIRVDEYLNTAKLGRMAFVAGDVQLAKDRFNLAMDLEFQTELENTSDFGVTGGILREELLARHEGLDDNKIAKSTDRLTGFLSRLEKIFTTADEKAAYNTADTQSFILMGAALSMIGEWDKAESVYKEGIAASPTENEDLVSALRRLNKQRDMLKLVDYGTKLTNTPRTPPRSPKTPRRPTSQLMFENSHVSRSQSFSSDLAEVRRSSSPILEKPSSPVFEAPRSPSISSPMTNFQNSPTQNKGKQTLMRFLRRDKRPKSQFIENGLSLSHSSEDLSDSGIWRQRSHWQSVFSTTYCSQLIQDFDSRTIQTMRQIDYMSSHSKDKNCHTSFSE